MWGCSNSQLTRLSTLGVSSDPYSSLAAKTERTQHGTDHESQTIIHGSSLVLETELHSSLAAKTKHAQHGTDHESQTFIRGSSVVLESGNTVHRLQIVMFLYCDACAFFCVLHFLDEVINLES